METKFDDNYDYLFTMCVVGDQSVGKSSLVQRYTENDFKCLDDIRPTVGIDFKLKYLSKYGHKILLQLWDSSGQKKYRNVINHFIARMMGVILVLDVTSTDSLSQLGHWIEVIRRHTFPETQVSEEPCSGMLRRGYLCHIFYLKSEVPFKKLKSYAYYAMPWTLLVM